MKQFKFLLFIIFLYCNFSLLSQSGKPSGSIETDTIQFPKEKLDSVRLYNYYQFREYAKANIKENEFSIYGQNYDMQSFDWQLTSEKILFFVVILIALCGVFFSGVQFYNSLITHRYYLTPKGAETIEPDPNEPNLGAQIKIDKDGIEIKSSILGIIILTLSIAFFYMYLHFVYPIN